MKLILPLSGRGAYSSADGFKRLPIKLIFGDRIK